MTPAAVTVVVGIDPSLTSTGIAVRARNGTVAVHRIESTGSATATWEERRTRLAQLAVSITAELPSDAFVVIEAPSYGSVGGAAFDRTGLWWFAYQALYAKGCRVIPVSPSQRAKYATGNGRASKDKVLAAAIRRYMDIDITGNDVADAVVLMAIGCRLLGMPIDDPMPALNLSALAKLPSIEDAA